MLKITKPEPKEMSASNWANQARNAFQVGEAARTKVRKKMTRTCDCMPLNVVEVGHKSPYVPR